MTLTICLHAARGGAGTTHLAANLAARLAISGKRVALVEANFYSPGIQLLLGLPAARLGSALNDYLRANSPLDEATYNVTARLNNALQNPDNNPVRGALFLLPARMSVDDITYICQESIDLTALTAAIQALSDRLHLDYVLVDTQAGLDPAMVLLSVQADLLLIPLRPDAQHFASTAHMVDAIRRLHEPEMQLVFNQVLEATLHTDLRKQAEAQFGLQTAAVLPFAQELAKLASKGLFAMRQPGHPWSRGLDPIVDVILAARTSRI